MNEMESLFSLNRLGSEPVPPDLLILLQNADELRRRTGITFSSAPGWSPWLDTSYLSDTEKRNPDIMASVRANQEVCGLIAFVAELEDSEYLGYWRGPTGRPIASSPLVILDNEGQFRLCAGSCFAEALLERIYDEERFGTLKAWLQSLGISIPQNSIDDFAYRGDQDDPNALSLELFERYRSRPTVA
jgi:hypothetical protein